MSHPDQSAIKYTQAQRLEYLDSIRGLAALAVLLSHLVGTFSWPPSAVGWCDLPFLAMMFDGRSAVTMFFVLSGFVLAYPYLEPVGKGGARRKIFLPTFYLRRATRIWLPWFFCLVVSLLARKFFFPPAASHPPMSDWAAGFWSEPVTLSSILRQCLFLLHVPHALLMPQDWSLGVELKGSLLIPVFLFFVRRSLPAFALIVVGLFAGLHTGQYYVTFALGVLAAYYFRRNAAFLKSCGPMPKYGTLLVGVLLYQSRWAASHLVAQTDLEDKIVWCVGGIGCVLIIGACLSSRRIQAKLNAPALTFLGRVSYSVYLLQFIVMLCILPPIIRGLTVMGIHSNPVLLAATMVLGMIITTALAGIMYRVIEVPSVELGRYLTTVIQSRTVGVWRGSNKLEAMSLRGEAPNLE